MSVLQEIVVQKKKEVEILSQSFSVDQVKGLALKGELSPRGFVKSVLSTDFPAIISEIKRASPSKGMFSINLDPVETAFGYQGAGAAAISVLIDVEFFHGELSYLAKIRQAGVSLPLLRKDFLIDEIQVWESRLAGADAVLLIVAILTDEQLRNLLAVSLEASLDVLLEVHTEQELERAVALLSAFENPRLGDSVLLGINNRDLNSFETDIAVTKRLVAALGDKIDLEVVSESGLKTAKDLIELKSSGVKSFLIGESLIVTGECDRALASLIESSREECRNV